MASAKIAHAGRLVLLFWVLVGAVYFYVASDYIRVSMNDDDFGEYLEYLVQVAGSEQRPAKEIRALLLVRAEELELPIDGNQITILGGGRTLNIAVDYVVQIEIPIFDRGIYTKHFNHRVEFKGSTL